MPMIFPKPDDFHVHLRSGDMMQSIYPFTAAQFARAVIMPNLVPAIKNKLQAVQYRHEILSQKPHGFTPLMALYLTEDTDIEDLIAAHQQGHIFAVKYYPAGATTNSHGGVRDIGKIQDILRAMEHHKIPLLLHGEVTDSQVDIFDKEAVFLSQILAPLMQKFPDLLISLEHITTKQAVDFVVAGGENIGATITPHHLIINRNDIFKGGIRPHYFCLPIAKRESHRLALIDIVASGHKRFFAGTDSAPHLHHAKESACGCAGIFNAMNAVEAYAQIFDECDILDKLPDFLSHHGANFHKLAINQEKICLTEQEWQVPEEILTKNGKIIPFLAGNTMKFKVINA